MTLASLLVKLIDWRDAAGEWVNGHAQQLILGVVVVVNVAFVVLLVRGLLR